MPQGGDVYRVRIMSSGTRGASGTQDLIDLMGKTKLTGRKRKAAQEVADTASRKLFKTTDTAQGDGDGGKGGPKEVKVCGQSGILYDGVFPLV